MRRTRRAFLRRIAAASLAVAVSLVGLALGGGLVVGCGGDEPEAAFDRLRAAIGTGDPALLYHALDTESRWAVDSIWGYHREMAAAAAALAEPARSRLAQRVTAAATAPTAAAWLGGRVAELAVLAPLGGSAQGLGTRAAVRRDGARATIVTTTGLEVPIVKGPDGRWGYGGLAARLEAEKGAAANDAARVAEDVRRLGAGGPPGPPK